MSSTFTCTLKFVVKDCDPNTGEPDDEGYEDEYVVSVVFIIPSYVVQFYFLILLRWHDGGQWCRQGTVAALAPLPRRTGQ